MIVAVALFNDEISPRFDCCTGLSIVDLEAGSEKARHVDLRGVDDAYRTSEVLANGAEVLLCGGIRRCDFFRFRSSGVQVISGLTGMAGERLEEFVKGKLEAHAPPFQAWPGRGKRFQFGRKAVGKRRDSTGRGRRGRGR